MCEGSITAGFLIVTSMFWTHKEQSVRVGYWYLMMGIGTILFIFPFFFLRVDLEFVSLSQRKLSQEW